MARILLAWEIGAGLGHVGNLLPVARALRARGHDVVLALRDTVHTAPMLRDSGLPVIQAPFIRERPHFNGGRPFFARSYTDILAFHGFDDIDAIEPVARAWRNLVATVQPDLVVAEHAPTLCVACFGRVPVCRLGTGFTVPPLRDGSFPPLNPRVPETVPQATVEAVMRELLARLGTTAPPQPLAAVLGDEALVITVGLLDPYRADRPRTALGPYGRLPPHSPVPSKPYAFVYLPADHPAMRDIVAGLMQLPIPGTVYVRDASPALQDALRLTPLTVLDSPARLDELMPRVSVVLHHCGAGISQQSLAWGRPQVLAPVWLEQKLTANALIELGVADRLDRPGALANLPTLLTQTGKDRKRVDAARRIAAILRDRFAGGALDTVIARIEAHLPAGSTPATP